MKKDLNNKDILRFKKEQRKKRLSYLLIMLILIVFWFQSLRSSCINITKYFQLNSKIDKLECEYKDSKLENELLQQELESYKSVKGAEKIARNNLKMAAQDEVLVIIKDMEKK